MARLLPGENAKIDNINNLVYLVQNGNDKESNESLKALLDLFNPLLLKLCDKWSTYFNDKSHRLKSFDELMSDCIYWFYHYTKHIYIIDGRATYNKFIKDHIDQRIRYIYECEIKYHSKLLFPDPYKESNDNNNVLEDVINKYSEYSYNSPDNNIIDSDVYNAKNKLANRVLELMNTDLFNDRERTIFIEVVCNQITHEELSTRYGISRTRVTQIFAKTKDKLYKKIESDAMIWQLLDDADIDIVNPKLGGINK